MAEKSFLAPDGVTIMPNSFDLGRSVQLMAVRPNQTAPVYVTHEDPKITYRFKVNNRGMLAEKSTFIARGEYSNLCDSQGNVYVAEGEILVHDPGGNEMKRITLNERIHSMTWGGKDKKELFVTTSTAFYRVKW
jgi:sugar lactone lactonase YvrE